MGEHGTAPGWTVGQIGELLAVIARSLGPALKGRNPKEVLEKLGKNGKRFTEGLEKLVDEIMREKAILKLLTLEALEIEACDGTEIIAEQTDLFLSGIDPDFRDWGADEKGSATEVAEVSVYEMVENATFAEVFVFLSEDLAKLCLTQAQIIRFIKKYRQWLRADGYATFFPFKSKGNFFVARVRLVSSGKLHVFVNRAGNSDVWYAKYRHRLVVPCLPPACR